MTPVPPSPEPEAPVPAPSPETAARSTSESRRRRRDLVLSLAVVVALAAVVLFEQRVSGLARGLSVGDSTLFLLLNAVNVILIVLLVFLIARNLVKLLFERRQGILGSHLNVKLVLAFLLIATVPMAILFVVSAFFMISSINTWFSLQVDRALDQSRKVAEVYYDTSAQNALYYGKRIAQQIKTERLLREDRRAALTELVQAKQREYNLGVVEVFSATGEELVTAINPEIPAATFSRADSDLVRSALAGVVASRVQEAGSGEVIRGAVPIPSSFRAEEAVGAVVVNYFVASSLARTVAEIRAALHEYRTLQPNAGHIRTLYLLELLLVFLVIMLFATWWVLRTAKGITVPIRALAEGTAEVARGNLDVVVDATTDDEVGFLVQSFNRMIHDLREARGGLELSNSELEQRRRYMEVVLRNIGAGVLSLDADGRIGTINPPAQRLLGVPPGVGVIGRKLEEVLTRPEHLEMVREFSAKLRAGFRESIRRQVQLPAGDELQTLLVTLTLLQDEDGRRLGMVLVLDDHSQLVKMQRMAAWREVARRIAHEIKNPLTPIQLSAQRIRRRFRGRVSATPEEAKIFDECVNTITSQVDGLKLLVNEFSTFARLPDAKPMPEDLNRIVSEAVASYKGTERVAFVADLDAELPSVDVDREQMRRLLTNLIDNAIGAIRERVEQEGAAGSGRIELRTVHDAPLGTVRLEVADDGSGIPPEDRRRVFEPYFSTKQHGTGLGLAIVSRIVADHHGYIRVHDNKPRGTRFIVELPVRGA